MKIGYLHIGSTEHGVCRYGRILAAEARMRPELTVTEAAVTLAANRQLNRNALIKAASCFSEMDLIHLQYSIKNNKHLWGQGWTHLTNLKTFRQHCQQPFVVTLHDVYTLPPNPQNLLNYLNYLTSPRHIQIPISTLNSSQTRNDFSLSDTIEIIRENRWRIQGKVSRFPEDISLHWLLKQVQHVFVSSSEEAKRLSQSVGNFSTKVISHFVENRVLKLSKLEAKKALNLEGYKIITLLGFIHSRKGHQLTVEALPSLPQDVKVIFVGGASPGQEDFLQDLLCLARSEGVSDRLRITGYLSEKDLEIYLIATDLAICPFQSFSASGSLSTWISAARPILAYELPQITEYNQIVPASIKTFKPYTSETFAKAIMNCLSTNLQEEYAAIIQLRDKLILPEIFDIHLAYYKTINPIISA